MAHAICCHDVLREAMTVPMPAATVVQAQAGVIGPANLAQPGVGPEVPSNGITRLQTLQYSTRIRLNWKLHAHNHVSTPQSPKSKGKILNLTRALPAFSLLLLHTWLPCMQHTWITQLSIQRIETNIPPVFNQIT